MVVTATDAVTAWGVVEVADPTVAGVIVHPTPTAEGAMALEIPVPIMLAHLRLVIVTPAGKLKVTFPELLVVAPEWTESALLPMVAERTVTGKVVVRTMLVVESVAVTVKV